jgi:PAS domain S-box-containing protein
VSLTISPIRDDAGEVVGASKIVRDVTRQRQIEQRERRLLADAAEANAKFQAFFEQGAVLAGILDVRGMVLEANRSAWEGCGYARDQIVGQPISGIPWWRSPAGDEIAAGVRQAAAGQTFRAEMRYVVADGSERIADVTIQPITDATGEVLFLAAMGVDITERTRLENDLRRVAADLSEADRRKNEFLAMLAHELRNPLAPISNATQALRLAGGDGEAIHAATGMLERQVGQMSRLVDDLLDMSRITRGRIELRKARVELAPVVEHAVEAARAIYRSMNRELTVAIPAEPIPLDADATRLAQVIGNLLHNACKFTEPGGHVWLTVERQGARAAIRVRDNGIGLAAEHLSRIFEMFAQVDTSLERSRGGLGIGLTLVKTLVDMHGGTVEVCSQGLGHGSEFTVRLPVAVAAAEPAVREAAAEALTPAGRRILIVDDSLDGAESLAILLQFIGHETHLAHDGITALDAAERLRPDAVLLDIGLPGLNGYEVCRRIRQQSWGQAMTLVALTGWGQDEDRHRSREAGFDAHLVKPVDHDALAALLAAAPRSGSR